MTVHNDDCAASDSPLAVNQESEPDLLAVLRDGRGEDSNAIPDCTLPFGI